jgi:transposase-like protein
VKYSPEEKAAAIARVRGGEKEAEVARDLGMSRGTLNSWLRHEVASAGTAAVLDSVEFVAAKAAGEPRSEAYGIWLPRLRASRARLGKKVVAAFVEFGNDLIAAKKSVVHGEWYPLLEELGIDPTKAERMMNIAAHPWIADPSHAQDLPADYTSLAEIARLDPDQCDEAHAAGEIHPEARREDVTVLVRKRLDELPPDPGERKPGRPRKKGTRSLQHRLRLIIDTTDEEIPEFIKMFPTMYDELFSLIEMARDRLIGLAAVMEGVSVGDGDG